MLSPTPRLKVNPTGFKPAAITWGARAYCSFDSAPETDLTLSVQLGSAAELPRGEAFPTVGVGALLAAAVPINTSILTLHVKFGRYPVSPAPKTWNQIHAT